MNVLYTCDNNYVWIMGISMISLFENNKHLKKLKVHLLGENIDNNNKKTLMDIASKYGRCLEIFDVPQLDIPESLVTARWPLSAFTRLFSASLLPESIEQILYIDCDTVVVGNIGALELINFNNNIVLGVKDCISCLYKENIGIDKNDIYLNAGVLLINLNELRKIDIKLVIDMYMKQYKQLINYADQDILNGIFKGKLGVLEPRYNVMTIDVVHNYKEIILLRKPSNFYNEFELNMAVRDPAIIHYTTNMRVVRPWFTNTDHPLANEFLRYFKISPWAGKKLEEKVFSSKETKAIGFINKFPSSVSYTMLGFIHSVLRPLYIRVKSKYKN